MRFVIDLGESGIMADHDETAFEALRHRRYRRFKRNARTRGESAIIEDDRAEKGCEIDRLGFVARQFGVEP